MLYFIKTEYEFSEYTKDVKLIIRDEWIKEIITFGVAKRLQIILNEYRELIDGEKPTNIIDLKGSFIFEEFKSYNQDI